VQVEKKMYGGVVDDFMFGGGQNKNCSISDFKDFTVHSGNGEDFKK
jgi:hypothetical protein